MKADPLPEIMRMCEESRKRMNSYTPEQRAELERHARKLIAQGAAKKRRKA